MNKKQSLTKMLANLSDDLKQGKVNLIVLDEMDEHYLIELILDALAEFAHRECPYCQSYLDKHIDEEDIRQWLRK